MTKLRQFLITPPNSRLRQRSAQRQKSGEKAAASRSLATKEPAPEGPAEPAVIATETPSVSLPPVIIPEQAAHTDPAPSTNSDWPEPEAPSTGGQNNPSESSKRNKRRRRKKGKGNQANNESQAGSVVGHDEIQSIPFPESKSAEGNQDQQRPPRPHSPQQPQRAKIDPEQLSKMAWKIYLAEVSEEGVALISDGDARDLSRRCFRLAEIFIEEQMRRH
ncbi:MAG: hypothetical protein HC845_01725 [Akkermansiaceae bacterium]|nr:hypothetical protein [Akkermansiaceae bacterium]